MSNEVNEANKTVLNWIISLLPPKSYQKNFIFNQLTQKNNKRTFWATKNPVDPSKKYRAANSKNTIPLTIDLYSSKKLNQIQIIIFDKKSFSLTVIQMHFSYSRILLWKNNIFFRCSLIIKWYFLCVRYLY